MTFNPEQLKITRELKGFSQRELARQAGVSKSHVSDIERNERTPSSAMLRKLAAALDVPAWWFDHETKEKK